MARRALLFLLLHVGFITAWAEESWVFHPYPFAEHLSFEQIRDVLAMPDGTVWLASHGGGVARIGGTDWRTFDSNAGMPSNNVRCVETDGEDGVWAGTDRGLCHICGERTTPVTSVAIPGVLTSDILSLTRLRDGTTWVGTVDGHVARFQPTLDESKEGSEGTWSLVADPDTTEGSKIYDIFEDRDGSVWVAMSRAGMLKHDGSEWRRFGPENPFARRVRSFAQDAQGYLWVAGGEFLCRFKDGLWEELPESVLYPSCISTNEDGQLFVGTETGLWTRTDAVWERIDLGKETGARVVDIEFGPDGAIWLGTYAGPIRGEELIWRAFRETVDGVPLFGTVLYGATDDVLISYDRDQDLVRFDGQSWRKVVRLSESRLFPQTPTHPIDGKSWICSPTEAIQVSIPLGSVVKRVPIPSDFQPLGLFSTSRWNLGLISKTGFYVFKDDSWSPIPRDPSDPRGKGTAVEEAPDGSLFVCYEDRVERWFGNQVESLSQKDPMLRDLPYRTICCSRDGSVWIGTYGAGLFRYDAGTVDRFDRKNGLQSDYVSSVYEASDGTLWVGHRQKGVSSYRDGRWICFSSQHGLPLAMITRIAEHPEGTIWLAAEEHGMFAYRPKQGNPETTVVAAPKEIPPRGIGIFSFSGFDTLNRTPEEDLRYSWRIRQPFDQDSGQGWSPYSATTTLTASPRLPGKYVFEVRAADEDRNVDPTPASWGFSLAYPLWQRQEFLFPVGILSFISLVSLALFYRRHLALQQSESELRRSESELRESEARFRTMADSAPVLIWVSDTDGLLEFFNRGWLEFTGRTFEQERGHGWIEGIHPEGRDRCLETYRTALKGRESFVGEWRMLRHDKEYRWLLCTGLPRFAGDGEFLGYIGSCTDITDRKHSEQEREKLISELQDALGHVKQLSGLLPICASCKKVRDDGGYWQQIEAYISDHSEADFSHSICPECVKELYPDLDIPER